MKQIIKDHWELDLPNTGQQENQMTGLRFCTMKSKIFFDLSNFIVLLGSGYPLRMWRYQGLIKSSALKLYFEWFFYILILQRK